MRRNVELNNLGERTEISDVLEQAKTIPARVRINEGDAWYANLHWSL